MERVHSTAPRLLAVGLALTSLVLSPMAQAGEITATPAETVTWTESGLGPLLAPILGDMGHGQHLSFVRLPAGFVSPAHTHSHDYTAVQVTGVSRHYPPGGRDDVPDLAPGSTWSVPGDLVHVSECLPGADCIFALFQGAGFDLLPQ